MLTMKRTIRKTCPCCRVVFETTRKDKVYLDATHQKYHNNAVQNRKRDKNLSLTKEHTKTYQIFRKLLRNNSDVTRSVDFWEGKGADLSLFTGSELIEGKHTFLLFDLALIHNDNFLTIKQL
jgi:hypothetical protein